MNKETLPLISVIIPVKGRPELLKQSLKSVYQQTYKNIEVIIFEADKNEKIINIISSFLKKGLNIKHFYVYYIVISYSRNQAIRKATGKYIAFLDSDDLWYKNKLQTQVEKYEKEPNTGLFYHDALSVDDSKKTAPHSYIRFSSNKPYSGNCFLEFYSGPNIIPTSSVMTTKAVLEKVGLFNEKLKGAEDRELWLRIAQIYPLEYIDDILSEYHYNSQNFSQKNPELMKQAHASVDKIYKKHYEQLKKQNNK